MDIEYTKRELLAGGLSQPHGPFVANLGYFLFEEAGCYFGVLPPFNMLNKTMQTGRLISAENTVLEWKPRRISRMQYEELKRDIRRNPQWGGEVDEGYRGSRKYWERWAILRSVNKMAASY